MKRILAMLFLASGVAHSSDLDIVHEVINSDPERVGLLLREGVDPNLRLGPNKETVLMFAVRDLVAHAEKVYDSQLISGLAKATVDLGVSTGMCLSGMGVSTVFGLLSFLSARAIDVRWAAIGAVAHGFNPFGHPRGVRAGLWEAGRNLLNLGGTAFSAAAAADFIPAADMARDRSQQDVAEAGMTMLARQGPDMIRNLVTDRATVTAVVFAWTAAAGIYLVWRGLVKGWKGGSGFVQIPATSLANARALVAEREIIRMLLLHHDLDINVENSQGKTVRDFLHEAMLIHIENEQIYRILREIDEWMIDVENVAYACESKECDHA
ncbi:hypothetical protein JW872_00695 [Candidatus Babeliales bacterium]|nr:hypothetical protein [Candidatus Babeliales bacterium]